MAENPHPTVKAEQHQTQMEIAAVSSPSLWTHLEQHKQKQIAQILSELIRRSQRQPLNLEDRDHV